MEDITKNNGANENRNQIIHSSWTTEDNSNRVSRFKIKPDGFKGIKYITKDMEQEEIKILADGMKFLADELMDLLLIYIPY